MQAKDGSHASVDCHKTTGRHDCAGPDRPQRNGRERGKERCYQMWKSDAGIERSEIDFVTTDVLLELESVFPFFSVSVENIRDKTVLKQRKRIYKGRGGVRM